MNNVELRFVRRVHFIAGMLVGIVIGFGIAVWWSP